MIDARENIHYNQFLKLSSTIGQWLSMAKVAHDYPAWKSVYYYYHKWRQEGRVEHFLEKLVRKIRRKRGQASSPSVGAIGCPKCQMG